MRYHVKCIHDFNENPDLRHSSIIYHLNNFETFLQNDFQMSFEIHIFVVINIM